MSTWSKRGDIGSAKGVMVLKDPASFDIYTCCLSHTPMAVEYVLTPGANPAQLLDRNLRNLDLPRGFEEVAKRP